MVTDRNTNNRSILAALAGPGENLELDVTVLLLDSKFLLKGTLGFVVEPSMQMGNFLKYMTLCDLMFS